MEITVPPVRASQDCEKAEALRPKVMVIVPSYNEGAVLKNTVQQLLQTGHTIVVVDDGSRDDTSGGVKELPIVYLRHSVNLGQGAALETGMSYALRAGANIVVHF